MGANIKKWSGVIVLAALMSATGSSVLAQEAELESVRLETIPEAIDRNGKLSSFFTDAFIGGDAKFLLGLDYEDNQLIRDGRRLEVLYRDLMDQQDRDHPIVRTRDIPNPYSTSLSELQGF